MPCAGALRGLAPSATASARPLERLAHTLILSWGWRRWGLGFGAGALSALAQPPFFAFPILWVTFPAFVWLVDGAVEAGKYGRVRRIAPAFRIGWWFGFGYFLAGLWWVGAAFLVEAEEFGWLMPFAVLALPAGLALFWGLGVAAAQLLWSEDWRRVFALAGGVGAAEWLRGVVFTGFPWNALGYALTAGEVLMQSAALLGVEALSFLAVLIFAAPACLVTLGTRRAGKGDAFLPALAMLALAALAAFGIMRLAGSEQRLAGDVTVRIVQPALDQSQKGDPELRDAVMEQYLALSAPDGAPLAPNTLLVWPETALPFALTEEPTALAAIGGLLPPQTALVTGAYRVEEVAPGERRVFNSLYLIDDTGTIQDSYDKIHLVPFGEYLPLQSLLERLGLRQLARMPGGFSAGARRRSINLPFGPPFSPLICYEIIFPGAVMPEGPRPGFLLNVTNDGWFGRTAGPYQHLHQARVRSVEEGLPLVRAANTGISAVLDSYGRVVARSDLGETGTIEAALPAGLAAAPFAGLRRISALFALALCLLVAGSRFIYPTKDRI